MNPFLLIQRSPIKRRRSKTRRGPWRSVAYRRWISEHRSCVSFPNFKPGERLYGVALSEAAHTDNNGMSSKGPDSSCVPLTPEEHREYDAGRNAFEKKHGIDMQAIAALYWKQYQVEHAA